MKKLLIIFLPLLICSLIFSSSLNLNVLLTEQMASTVTVTTLPTIIIDPGHGGFDGGTQTNDGTPEKDINLQISLYIQKILIIFGFNTVITRNSDISLENDGLETIRQKKTSDIHNRMAIMENTDNAVFVSIHQNHYSVERYNGLQVFYSRNFSGESTLLAQSIQESVVSLLQPQNTRQIKECGNSVYLIYNAVKPAVLVECGFLSNIKEAELLKTDEYQRKIAYCIVSGIQNYSLKE